MDDFNGTVLSQAKNEYSLRLVNILTPLIMEGIKSIFNEAYDLCIKNGEDNKYLMTFQNFLTRVPKWNQEIINTESERIIQRSNCKYLEEILTCVHIAQLKILTSIRVATHQKKIDIDIPKLSNFIHRVYIECARKMYQNVYLYEKHIMPLLQQKNMRECETIVRECILKVIQDSMPIEKILRAYIDETTEEEIIEETVNKTIEEIEQERKLAEQEKSENNTVSDNVTNSNGATTTPERLNTNDKPLVSIDKVGDSIVETQPKIAKDVSQETKSDNIPVPVFQIPQPQTEQTKIEQDAIKQAVTEQVANVENQNTNVTTVVSNTNETNVDTESATKTRLSFSDNDNVLSYDKTEKPSVIMSTPTSTISAPKTIERLEKISTERNEQRKLEDDEDFDDFDDKLKIMDTVDNVNLDVLDINMLDNTTLSNDAPILTDIEVLA